jgi:hypothetical protein
MAWLRSETTVRRLSRREKRLVVVLCGVAALGAASFYMAPEQGPNPEEVVAYYIRAFGSAKQITIRTPDGKTKPVTVTRESDRGLFSRLETAARLGGVTIGGPPQPPRYMLDLVAADRSEIKDISVGFTLDCPKQPARGKLAFIPREMGSEGPVPVMALIIEDYLDPAGAKERRAKMHEEMRRFAQQRGGAVRGGMRQPGRSGRGFDPAQPRPTPSGAEGRPMPGSPQPAPGAPAASRPGAGASKR